METSQPSDNPFISRRVRPGAIPFFFPPGQTIETVVDRLRDAGWWGEIIGPHGSGKSTLLASLDAAVRREGRLMVVVELHDQQRRLPLDVRRDARLQPPAVLAVDGYEQLGYWNRMLLKRFCRRRGIGLLVTAHKPVGLPRLYDTVVTPELAGQVVAKLLGDRPPAWMPDELLRCLRQHDGDLREVLFDLYDWYQLRRPASGQNMT